MTGEQGAGRLRLAARALLGLALLLLLAAAGQSLGRYAAWWQARPLEPSAAVRQEAGPASGWLPGVLAAVPPGGRLLYAAGEMQDLDWLAAYYLYPRALQVRPPADLFPGGRPLAAGPGTPGWLLAGGRLFQLPAGRRVDLPEAAPDGFPPGPPDGRGWLALALMAAAATGAGGLVLRRLAPPLDRPEAGGGRSGRAGLALLAGLGLLGAVGFAAALGGAWGQAWLAWLLTAAGLAALPSTLAWIAAGTMSAGAVPAESGWRRPAAALLAGLVALLVLASLARAVGEPMLHWDERFQWAYKAKILLHEGGIDGPSFQDPLRPHLHRRYPLLVPALEAHAATLAGGWQERAVKGLFPLFFAGLLLAAHGAFRLRLAPLPAWLLTALLAALPPLHHAARIQGGPAHTGFADLPLAAFLAAGTLLLLCLRPGTWSLLPAVSLMAGFALLTKPEGIAMAAALLATALWAGLGAGGAPARLTGGGARPWQPLAVAGLVFLLLALPRLWLGWSVPTAGTVGYTGDEAYLDRLTPSHLAAGAAANLAPAALAMAAAPFAWRWACVGLLPLAGLAATWLAGRRGGHRLVLLLAIPLAADLLAFMVTGSTIQWHLGVALDRLWMQVMVPLLCIAAGQIGRLYPQEAA